MATRYIMGLGTTACKLTVGGVDLTSYARSITINQEFNEVDVTGLNSVAVSNYPGLINDSWEIEWFQTWDASAVDATLYPLLGTTTGATFIFQTNGGTVTSTMPKYTLVGTLYSYQPVNGTVGDVSMTTTTVLPIPGGYTSRGTS